MSHDVIVIGAGVNGLAAAHTMARRGKRVLVLEQGAGGADGAHGAEGADAFAAGWVPEAVVRALELERHGFRVERPDPWVSVALDGGARLELSQDLGRSVEAIRTVSPADADKWPAFCQRMRRVAAVFEELSAQPAPDVETTDLGELLRLGLLGLRVRRLGRQGMIDLLRWPPMSIADLLDEWFTHDGLKAALAAAALMHLRQGPRSGGTAYTFLHHHQGSTAGVFRPPLSNARAVLAAMPGVTVRHGARVTRIQAPNGGVAGVELAGGETVSAMRVVSGADPRATLLDLLEPGWLDPDMVHAVRAIKCRGVVARVTFTLDRAAPFSTLTLAHSLAHLERAFDDAKYGRASADPWIEARGLGSRVEAHVQFVPHALRGAAWDEPRRTALRELVLERLAEHVPELPAAVTGHEVVTPADLAARGLTEGNAYHGELTLDQILFARPMAGWSRYRTPVRGLYLCGAGTHPGGAVAGASGWLAGRAVLEDMSG